MSTPTEVAEIIARNRLRKATALADVLQDAHIDAPLAQEMNEHAWHIAAAKAGTKPPSEDTVALTIRILEQREVR